MCKEWQKIETAPKNGLKIVLFYRDSNGNEQTVFGRWLTDEQAEDFDHDDVGLKAGWYECIENWDEYCAVKIKGQPTHWMYKPQFPQSPTPTAEHPAAQQPIYLSTVSIGGMSTPEILSMQRWWNNGNPIPFDAYTRTAYTAGWNAAMAAVSDLAKKTFFSRAEHPAAPQPSNMEE